MHVYNNEDSYDIGEIVKNDDEWFKLYCYGTKKTLTRMHRIMKRESISRVVVDSPYQNGIVSLHSIKL